MSTVLDSERNACLICGNEYRHRESLRSHIKKHQGLTTCPKCGTVCGTVKALRRHLGHMHSLSVQEVRQIVPTRDPERNVCHICGKEYKHVWSLTDHVKKHRGMTTCPMCGKVGSTVKALRRHLQLVHSLSREAVHQIVPTRRYVSYATALARPDHSRAKEPGV
ncbi:zinc finger protein 77-like [Pollicipes pollicipes]|uniref:zinc finger protein 77-like n=1 Tax=Pollicipes pollicipes TaxID=41117 RepID=UPI0018852FCB|nr:zinc finger protein 77-like [Pollicipes pollicipes]